MLPSNEDERRKILHASIFDPYCKESLYLEEALIEVTKEHIKYNLKFPLRETLRFCAKNYPLLPKREFITLCMIVFPTWEIDDNIDNPRDILRLRIRQLESARSAFTSGKIEPYMSTTDCLLHHINTIKCGYLKSCLKNEYLSYIDIVERNIYSEKRVMSPEEYLEYRRIDFLAVYAYMLMFLDVDDFKPYHNYFHSEEGKKMINLASETGIIHNDLMSLKKDKKEGKTSNYVVIWMQSYDMTEDEAIDKLALKAKENYEELLKMKDTVLDPIGKEVLHKLILETSGNLIWSIQSPRYC